MIFFKMKFDLSSLKKTWFIDLDGTVVKHNLDYMTKEDELLSGTKEFWRHNIEESDTVILVTNRVAANREKTEAFLKKSGIRYNQLITDLPNGERICVNDIKPSTGLKTAVAINVVRDEGVKEVIITRHG